MRTAALIFGALILLLAGSAAAQAQPYGYPPHHHHHSSCRVRVQRYCPDLPPRPGTARVCAARLRLPVQTFCHGRFRVAPAVAAVPPGAAVYAPPGAIVAPPPAPGYYGPR